MAHPPVRNIAHATHVSAVRGTRGVTRCLVTIDHSVRTVLPHLSWPDSFFPGTWSTLRGTAQRAGTGS